MGGHYIRGRARSAHWAWSFSIFAIMLLPITVIFFRLQLLDQPTLSWSFSLAGALATSGLLMALFAIAQVWRTGAAGGGRAVAALVAASFAALPFAGAIYLFTEYPEGNFAQTNGITLVVPTATAAETASVDDPPQADLLIGRDFQATASMVYGAVRTALEDSEMEVADVSTSATPRPEGDDLGVSGTVLVPLPTSRDSFNPDDEYDRFAGVDADEYTIQAVAYAPIFAFQSDVTIRITEESGETFVDMRSVSRTLEHDLGQNRRIIESFFARVEEAMNVLEGLTPES